MLEPEAKRLLNAVGLSRMNYPPARLSGGERQRVGMPRTRLGNPDCCLDAGSTDGLIALLNDLRQNATDVVATHDPAVAAIAHGVIPLQGTIIVEELSQRPADDFVVRE
jgi:putative ABC transport system ATP-binding protein